MNNNLPCRATRSNENIRGLYQAHLSLWSMVSVYENSTTPVMRRLRHSAHNGGADNDAGRAHYQMLNNFN